MIYLLYLLAALVLAGLSLAFFRSVNHGLSVRSMHQQTTRFAIGSLIAVAPVALAGQLPGPGAGRCVWPPRPLWPGAWPIRCFTI